MLKKIALAAGLVLISGAAMAQNQGSPNGLPEVPGMNRDNAARFHQYVVQQKTTSYTYAQPVAVGTVLPESGVVYQSVPSEYGPSAYRYTVVNNRTVLVDPGTRRIVQVIE